MTTEKTDEWGYGTMPDNNWEYCHILIHQSSQLSSEWGYGTMPDDNWEDWSSEWGYGTMPDDNWEDWWMRIWHYARWQLRRLVNEDMALCQMTTAQLSSGRLVNEDMALCQMITESWLVNEDTALFQGTTEETGEWGYGTMPDDNWEDWWMRILHYARWQLRSS